MPRLLITCYHHVGVPQRGAPHQRTWVSQAFLAAHLSFLAGRGYQFCTVSQALARDGLRACITFDDGFADVADARPVLDAFGAKATLYVVTDELGRVGRTWDGGATANFVDAAQVRALAAHGWEIGSHADTHTRLRGQSAEVQRARLSRSREALSALLVTSPDNPRSLAWVAQTLRARLRRMQELADGGTLGLAALLPETPASDSHPAPALGLQALLPLLAHHQRSARQVAEGLSSLFFTHSGGAAHSVSV